MCNKELIFKDVGTSTSEDQSNLDFYSMLVLTEMDLWNANIQKGILDKKHMYYYYLCTIIYFSLHKTLDQ